METDLTGRRPPLVAVAGPGHRLPAPARLGPVRLQIAELGRSEEFYTQVMGLRVRDRGKGRLALSAGDAHESLVELVERPSVRPVAPRSRLGLFHYALLVPDRRSLADFALHADQKGVPLGMSDHLVSEALYLRDPDGMGIEVYADRPRREWQRSRGGQWVMATDPLNVEDLLAAATGETYGGLPTGTLGFDAVVRDYPGALFFSAGGYHHHVGTNVWAPAAPSPGADDARLLSWTLVLPEETDIRKVAAVARAGDQDVTEKGPLGGLLLSDPWATPVEIVAEASVAAAYRKLSSRSQHNGGTP